MWLLSTDRAELHFFPSPENVPGGYAILSHVWGAQEMSFQDIQQLRKWYSAGGFKRALRLLEGPTRSTNSRDYASSKVRQSCTIAERHGYKWIWNDTCCIDKSSSFDLSEVINSMYQYYSLAEVCYAFLEDVPKDGISIGDYFAFRNSRWHRRGWTLQELIAPSFLIFLSQDWEVLGTKADLADVLQSATGIPASVLRKETDLVSISVIERMTWASQRVTTRVEDEAYCLMGIFSINMTTLYGEGRQAFYRLQEKIMKRSVDTSLFLWGKRDLLAWHFDFGLGIHEDPIPDYDQLYHNDISSYLLASSPRDFVGATTFVYAPPTPSTRSSNLVCLPSHLSTSILIYCGRENFLFRIFRFRRLPCSPSSRSRHTACVPSCPSSRRPYSSSRFHSGSSPRSFRPSVSFSSHVPALPAPRVRSITLGGTTGGRFNA